MPWIVIEREYFIRKSRCIKDTYISVCLSPEGFCIVPDKKNPVKNPTKFLTQQN